MNRGKYLISIQSFFSYIKYQLFNFVLVICFFNIFVINCNADIWMEPDRQNKLHVSWTLKKLGAPLLGENFHVAVIFSL